jgi:hypothetical protein
MKPNQWLVKTEQHRENLIKFFTKFEIPACGALIEWCEADSKRTSEQNSLMWVSAYRPIAIHLSEQSGKVITLEMVHMVAKDRFLDPIIVELNGKTKRYPGSTTKLGKKKFSDYLEQVYAWGAEMGVYFQ